MKFKVILISVPLSVFVSLASSEDIDYCPDGSIRAGTMQCDDASSESSGADIPLNDLNITCADGSFVASKQECYSRGFAADQVTVGPGEPAEEAKTSEAEEYCETGELKRLGNC